MQANHIRVNLDRVLMDPAWGMHFPLCNVVCLRRVGSNLTPILLSTGEDNIVKGAHFHFEKQWLLIPNFKEVVFRNIAETKKCFGYVEGGDGPVEKVPERVWS
jgi:hypothetical protein